VTTESLGTHNFLERRPNEPGSGASVTARTFEILLDQILTFRLKPHEFVSEKTVSEAVGVSRTPVREALARLAGLGLIDIYPQRGSRVAPLRVADLEKSQFLREALELGLVKRAVESPTRQLLVDKLKAELAIQETFATIADDRRFFKSDELFHRHIAAHAGLPGIWADISAAKLHMDRFRALSFPRLDSMAVVLGQHRRIVAALDAGDLAETEEAMRSHLRRIFDVLDEVKARHSQFFEASDLAPATARPGAAAMAQEIP